MLYLDLNAIRWVTACNTVTSVPLCTFSYEAARSL
jgi:hypothetical protein